MLQFKLNNNPLSIMTAWSETSFKEYVALMIGVDTTTAISILTGVPKETLNKSTITGLEDVIQALSFLRTVPVIPAVVTQVGPYKLPLNSKGEFNIQMESLAQFEDLRQVIKKLPGNDVVVLTKSYPEIVAIYLQKLRDGEYDPDKAKSMVSDVEDMPALEVISAGSFFLTKLLALLTGTTPISHNTSQNQKKKKQALPTSKKPSVRSLQSSK